MVISIKVDNYGIGKVLVEWRSSVNILYWKTFLEMNKGKFAPYMLTNRLFGNATL